MGIKGFQGTSLLDFPGRLASLVFWGGCNLTCPFCHNPQLVLDPAQYPDYDLETLLSDLANRRPFIDGVVISGGEPTLDSQLDEVLGRFKALGLLVKLDTNGLAPKVVAELANKNLIDYLAIDLKTVPERYPELHGGPVKVNCLLDTVALSASLNIEVEYRTTCVPGWVDEATIDWWGNKIAGTATWAIQQFHAEHALDPKSRQLAVYSPAQVRHLASLAGRYVTDVIVRGV